MKIQDVRIGMIIKRSGLWTLDKSYKNSELYGYVEGLSTNGFDELILCCKMADGSTKEIHPGCVERAWE